MSDQPIHYAVLVPRETVAVPVEGQFDPAWTCIYANGDLAGARRAAENYALSNHGATAVIMAYLDHVTAGVVTTWAKPNV